MQEIIAQDFEGYIAQPAFLTAPAVRLLQRQAPAYVSRSDDSDRGRRPSSSELRELPHGTLAGRASPNFKNL